MVVLHDFNCFRTVVDLRMYLVVCLVSLVVLHVECVVLSKVRVLTVLLGLVGLMRRLWMMVLLRWVLVVWMLLLVCLVRVTVLPNVVIVLAILLVVLWAAFMVASRLVRVMVLFWEWVVVRLVLSIFSVVEVPLLRASC